MTQSVRRRAKRAFGASILAVVAFTATGCLQVSGQSEDQIDIIGSVEIATDQCTDNEATCSATQTSGDYQLLLGYRIPTTSEAPATIAATGTQNGTYTQTDQFSAELERKSETDETERWVGYVSNTKTAASGTQYDWSTRARFTLPDAPAGEVDPGTFASRTKVGYRSVSASRPAERDVNCDESGLAFPGLPGSTFPGTGTDCSDDTEDAALATRDLEVRGGGPVTGATGTSATVPFEAELGGPGLEDGQRFTLAGASDLGPVTLDQQEIVPSEDETVPVKATVTVPAGTPLGDYAVTLTATADVDEEGPVVARAARAAAARAATRETRAGTAIIRVAAPETKQEAPPAVVTVAPAATQQQAAPSLAPKACTSRRSFPIRVRERSGRSLASARVFVNGKQVRVVRGKRLRAAVVLAGLPKGTFLVKIVARTSTGKRLTGTRRYRTCIGKRPSGVPDL